MVQLQKASFSDLEVVQEIQRQSFKVWYDKYQDEHNPYLETKENIEEKFSRPTSFYYLIKEREKTVGFLRLQTNSEQKEGWLASVAIYPKEQRKGYASPAITLVEQAHSSIVKWDLCTIFQEKSLVNLYEKCGYKATHTESVQEGMDLVFMTKLLS